MPSPHTGTGVPLYLADDATFRAWATAIRAALVDVGLVVHTDTGQINLASVARPGTSAYAGYDIFRFDDDLQATVPIFLKVEYGIGGAADRPALRVSIGSGTNGSGTLTGQLSAAEVLLPTTSFASGNTGQVRASGGDGRVCLQWGTGHASSDNNKVRMFLVERGFLPTGEPGDEGAIFMPQSQGTAFKMQAVPKTGAVPSAVAMSFWAPDSGGMDTSAGGEISMFPVPVAIRGKVRFLTSLIYKHADIAASTPISVSHLGAVRSLMPLGTSLGPSNGFAFPWD